MRAFVGLSHVAQPLAEHFGVSRACRRLGRDARRHVELADAVIQAGIGFREVIALALAGDHVQELRAAQRPDVAEGGNQRVEIMAVDGAQIVEAELLEQRAGCDHALQVFLGPPGEFVNRRQRGEELFAAAA